MHKIKKVKKTKNKSKNKKTVSKTRSNSSNSKKWKRSRKLSNQLLIEHQFCWQDRMEIKMAHQIAPIATVSEIHGMARRLVSSFTRQASRPISLRSATTRSSYRKGSPDVAHMFTFVIRRFRAAKFISTRFLSHISKWISPRSRPWKDFTDTCRLAQSMWSKNQLPPNSSNQVHLQHKVHNSTI